MNILQHALITNAVFSGISGMLMILLQQPIAHLFGINTTPFWVLGILLIYFAGTIWYEIYKQRTFAIIWIIMQDAIWVIASILLIVFNPFQITIQGNLIQGIIAMIVLCMAVYQFIGLRKMMLSEEGMGF